ncbi:hypothetical protein [Occultella glacieicola]|uniref:hypothetical protein n=1 Tax=Occultella glacieicola TaxID=2518684 RepID=UPI0014049852|nr:hypothetical protein [Occultella glacieicola]
MATPQRDPSKFGSYGKATTLEGRRTAVVPAKRSDYDRSAQKIREAARKTR